MKGIRILIFPLAIALAGCGTFQFNVKPLSSPAPTLTAILPITTATAISVPTQQINPTETMEVPTATPALSTATQTQQPAPATEALTTASSSEQTVKIFLIALEDNGRSGTLVGCGDSAIPVTVSIPPTQGILRAALEKLLSAKQQYYGESGLYNAIYQSDLQVAGVTIEQGKAIIHLRGTTMLGGVCDAPRFEAQIRQTALQFSTVKDVAVFINDKPLEEVLSSK